MYGYRVNRVSVLKNAIGRYEYLRAVLDDASQRREWLRYAAAGLAEVAKFLIDTFAFTTHTDRWLLRHRARVSRDPAVIKLWQRLWSSLQASESGV